MANKLASPLYTEGEEGFGERAGYSKGFKPIHDYESLQLGPNDVGNFNRFSRNDPIMRIEG